MAEAQGHRSGSSAVEGVTTRLARTVSEDTGNCNSELQSAVKSGNIVPSKSDYESNPFFEE